MLVFEKVGKPEYPEKNLSVQSRSLVEDQQTQPLLTSGLGTEEETFWWEASALTTIRQSCIQNKETRVKLSLQVTAMLKGTAWPKSLKYSTFL